MAKVPVLLLVRQPGIGGAERDMSRVALRINREHFEPHVACLVSGGMRAEELEAAGVPVVELGVRSFRDRTFVRGARKLMRYIRDHRIQVVHAFDSPPCVFAAPFARLAGVPAVITAQLGHRSYDPLIDRVLRTLSDRLSHAIHINSQAMGADLKNRGEAVNGKLFLCYNGVDTAVLRPNPGAEKPAPLQGAGLVIAAICAMRVEKDLGTLIRAFAQAKLHITGAKLALVGGGPMTPEWRALADELGVAAACHFEPSTADVAPWMQAADIFVQASQHESFSNSLLEAMACGCAVVATDVGGTREMVTDGDNGLLFAPRAVEDLAGKLARLAGDPELRKRLGEQAVATANAELTVEKYVQRCSDKYLELLAAAQGKAR